MARKLPDGKPCPGCGDPLPWLVRVWPLRGPFTEYYVECSKCHYCGKTKVGKRRAIRSWNREKRTERPTPQFPLRPPKTFLEFARKRQVTNKKAGEAHGWSYFNF